jgi:hypothetical protein
LDASYYEELSHDLILNKGVPIRSKVMNEDVGIFNTHRFRLSKIFSCGVWMHHT